MVLTRVSKSLSTPPPRHPTLPIVASARREIEMFESWGPWKSCVPILLGTAIACLTC